MSTVTALLIQSRLRDKRLDEYVMERRKDGESWETIARTLYVLTEVSVTGETLRHWFNSKQEDD